MEAKELKYQIMESLCELGIPIFEVQVNNHPYTYSIEKYEHALAIVKRDSRVDIVISGDTVSLTIDRKGVPHAVFQIRTKEELLGLILSLAKMYYGDLAKPIGCINA